MNKIVPFKKYKHVWELARYKDASFRILRTDKIGIANAPFSLIEVELVCAVENCQDIEQQLERVEDDFVNRLNVAPDNVYLTYRTGGWSSFRTDSKVVYSVTVSAMTISKS